MRQLLLTAFGAWVALLLNSSAFAQLADETYTFSGEVASTCDFNLPENFSLFYRSDDNSLRWGFYFTLTTNSPVIRMGVSELTVIKEPPPRGSTTVPKVRISYNKEI